MFSHDLWFAALVAAVLAAAYAAWLWDHFNGH
jgi:hypothetical protein